MKKIMALVISLVTIFLASGCNIFRQDNNHAKVTITTEKNAYVSETVNTSNSTWSGQKLAMAHGVHVNLTEGETAVLKFKCESCGYEFEYEITQPFADIISCQCPEEMDENGNIKEYCAVGISYTDNSDATD